MLIRPHILLASFVASLAWLALNTALDGAPTEHQAAQAVAAQVQAVALDHNQVEADVMFEQRVQRTGDLLCVRTAGPGTRAVWSGPDETLRCVRRMDGDGQPRKSGDRLMLAMGGGSQMSSLQFVNYLGNSIDLPARENLKKPARAAASGPDEWHKGFRVVGHSPASVEDAREAHSKKQASKKPEDTQLFDVDAWARVTKKKAVRTAPYALKSAAETCAELARKSGWVHVEVVAVEKRKLV